MRLTQPFFVLIISLAAFGLLYRLITEPSSMISNVLIIAMVLFAFYAIYRYVSKPAKPKGLQKSGRLPRITPIVKGRPTRQTAEENNLYKHRWKRKRKAYPFKVIEGQKGKKKKPFSS